MYHQLFVSVASLLWNNSKLIKKRKKFVLVTTHPSYQGSCYQCMHLLPTACCIRSRYKMQHWREGPTNNPHCPYVCSPNFSFLSTSELILSTYIHSLYTYTVYTYIHSLYIHTQFIHTYTVYTHTQFIHTYTVYTYVHSLYILYVHSLQTYTVHSQLTKDHEFETCDQLLLIKSICYVYAHPDQFAIYQQCSHELLYPSCFSLACAQEYKSFCDWEMKRMG